MNKMMQSHHDMYTQVFLDPREEAVQAIVFDQDEFAEWGFTFTALDARLAYIDDLSPGEFDTYAEYSQVKQRIIQRETAAVIISAETVLFQTVNYKGEFVAMCTVEDAKNLPVYKGKNESFNAFGI